MRIALIETSGQVNFKPSLGDRPWYVEICTEVHCALTLFVHGKHYGDEGSAPLRVNAQYIFLPVSETALPGNNWKLPSLCRSVLVKPKPQS